MRQVVFQAPELGLRFEAVSLGPPYEKSQKISDLIVHAEFVITRLSWQFRSGDLPQNVVRCLHFKRRLKKPALCQRSTSKTFDFDEL